MSFGDDADDRDKRPAAGEASATSEAAERMRRYTARALGGPRSVDTCALISRRVARDIDGEVDALRAAGAALACEAGCAFCCHQRVGVFPHEAAALWTHLKIAMPPDLAAAIEERIAANARAIDAMTAEEHRAARMPCAFLVDGRCSAYEVRPSACASYHSLSRARCEYAFEHPEHAGTPRASRPALRDLRSFTSDLVAGVESGFAAAGVSTGKGELHHRVRAIAEDPGVIDRWLAGVPFESQN